MYKPSMFNFFFKDENEQLVLYNSYHGLKSIRCVRCEKQEKVENWLTSVDGISISDDCDFVKMCQDGYLVPVSEDEKIKREMLLMSSISDCELNLVIHTTKNCNFRCRYCALEFSSENMGLEVQESVVQFIKKHIHQYTGVHISWFGGEPLMAMDVIENISTKVISVCRRAKKNYRASITTNGYLLNPENMDILLHCKVFKYCVTIDGLKQTHDGSRFLEGGTPTFDIIVQNLKYIKEHVRTKALGMMIRSNVTSDELKNMQDYYMYFDQAFGDDSRFSLFVRPVGDWGGNRVRQIIDKLLKENEMGQFYEKLSKLKGKIKYLANYEDVEVSGLACRAMFINKFTISITGSISKCDNAANHLSVGQLKEDGEMEINDFRHAQWIVGKVKRDEKCEDCFISCACFMNGCPLTNVLRNATSCPISKKEIKDLLDFISKSTEIEKI